MCNTRVTQNYTLGTVNSEGGRGGGGGGGDRGGLNLPLSVPYTLGLRFFVPYISIAKYYEMSVTTEIFLNFSRFPPP